MYVICAGMYRTCSAWQYEVVAHLIESHWHGIRLGSMSGATFASFDELWADKLCWSVLRPHKADQRFSATINEGRAVAVYSYRDIRDVIYALMHERRVTFDRLLRR